MLFIAAVIGGFLFGGFLGAAIDGHGPPPWPWDATPKFAMAGAIIGGGAWLFYWFIAWWLRGIDEFPAN
jgi:hypothetical protein